MNIKKYYSVFVRFLIPVVFLVFIHFCSRKPEISEWYMRNLYPLFATVLSFINRWTHFSLLDMFVIVVTVLFLSSIILLCLRRMNFFFFIRTVLLSALWMTVWFYMAWGIGYFRLGFHERFGIEPPKEDREYFEAFVERYIDSLNRAYIANPHFDAKEIDNELEIMYAKHHEALRIPYPCGWRRTKKTIAEPLMIRMSVSGYFGPFFNEVHLTDYSLPITYPYTLAHEKAHQFGISNEAECNLYATVVCSSSAHPLVRYSGYLQTVSYLLGNLRKISPNRYRDIVRQIDPRIIADYRAIQEHWQKVENQTMTAVQEKVYDTYLRTNRQRSGILSYNEMTGLLVAWDLMNSIDK